MRTDAFTSMVTAEIVWACTFCTAISGLRPSRDEQLAYSVLLQRSSGFYGSQKS